MMNYLELAQPIETRYKGYRFRSRLEARWAVFFDALKMDWLYEPEGFEWTSYDEVTHRYLPDFYLPETATWVEIKGAEQNINYELLSELIDWGGQLPGVGNSVASTRGLLVLGPIPDASIGWPMHSILQHQKGVWRVSCVFQDSWYGRNNICVPCDPLAHQIPWDYDNLPDNGQDWGGLLTRRFFTFRRPNRVITDAYRAARSARFEHGESG